MATRKKPAAVEEEPVFYGSGNVFADLGLANADELLARAELLRQLTTIVERRRLTQVDVARILHLKQPDVSKLLRGRFLRRFSTDRLMRFLTALGHDVDIVVRPKARGRRPAQVRVVGVDRRAA
jgi:predicted XRE-type DNA-binding protein